jgi:ubiquinone/menaquinone biosynthesis C-methylase UbiE
MLITKIFDFYIQLSIKALDILGVSELGQVTFRKRTLYLLKFERFRNARFKEQGLLPDGLPIPPAQLIFLVYGGYDKKGVYNEGALGVECIKNILKKNGLEINAFGSILDFGCGCGRILRHWKTLSGPKIHGSDYNPSLVNWCQKSLSFAEVKQNKPYAKLDYENDKFDFIYVISVFTHLNATLQNFWIDELTRVLKPGGYLLITVHGNARMSACAEERRKFESGQLVVVDSKYLGTNFCNSFQSEMQVRKWLRQKLAIVDFVPGGAKDAHQDQYLLQKPIKGD